MIAPSSFCNLLETHGITFFTGVPDSLLKGLCSYLADKMPSENHIIAANEGGSVGIATGYHLATGRIPMVYMQNAGQGNAINPLASLADKEVYSIPMLLVVGWRGEPGTKDEPQHVKQGKITLELLDVLRIPYQILPDHENEAAVCVEGIVHVIRCTQAPAALVVKKGTFEPYKSYATGGDQYEITREQAIQLIVEKLGPKAIVVATTGKTSRELYECRDARGEGHSRDFLTVGSMGHASQIALGLALAKPTRQVFCLDGDGAALMHLGGLAIIGSQKHVANYKHIILNNGAHDSVGGQPTAGFSVSFTSIAKACGYKSCFLVETASRLGETLDQFTNEPGPSLLEIRVKKGARPKLGRPRNTPKENKANFMQRVV